MLFGVTLESKQLILGKRGAPCAVLDQSIRPEFFFSPSLATPICTLHVSILGLFSGDVVPSAAAASMICVIIAVAATFYIAAVMGC
jgi:hypothetical protein